MQVTQRYIGLLEAQAHRALAQGEVLAGDPGFFERQFEILATLTPEDVKAAMQKWLTRPALTVVLEPGEREGEYEEAASVGGSDGGDAGEAAESEITVTEVRPAPEIAQASALDFPDVTETTLSNGINVYYAQRDAVPATRVSISFDAGGAADPADKQGLEGLTLGLMDEATTSLTARELAEAQERLGANISIGGGTDRSTFTLSALTANLQPSLSLLSDVVRNPAFNDGDIERVRAQTITGIEQSLKSPSGIAQRTLRPLVYGASNAYGGISTVESVGALTRDDLVEFKNTWLRPDNAQVFVVSDLALSEVMPQLEAAFGVQLFVRQHAQGLSLTPGGRRFFMAAKAVLESGAARYAFDEILIDQGMADGFLDEQLKPELFEEACEKAGQRLILRRQEGYDHSYFFIQSFIEDHLEFHRVRLS